MDDKLKSLSRAMGYFIAVILCVCVGAVIIGATISMLRWMF